jgi:hypothetical protein
VHPAHPTHPTTPSHGNGQSVAPGRGKATAPGQLKKNQTLGTQTPMQTESTPVITVPVVTDDPTCKAMGKATGNPHC